MNRFVSGPWVMVGMMAVATARWTWRWWTTGNPAWFQAAGLAAAVLLFTIAIALPKEPTS